MRRFFVLALLALLLPGGTSAATLGEQRILLILTTWGPEPYAPAASRAELDEAAGVNLLVATDDRLAVRIGRGRHRLQVVALEPGRESQPPGRPDRSPATRSRDGAYCCASRPHMHMRRAARVAGLPCLLVLAAAGLLPVGAGAGSEQSAVARVVLVSPANGALIQRSHVTFVWRVEWLRPPASGAVQMSHRYASDRAMTQQVSTTTRTCPATDVNCWTRHRPSETFYGRYYWQVTLTGAVQAASAIHLLSVSGPRDELDRRWPTVRALAGSAARGRHALFLARVSDNSGEARLDAQLTHRGVPVVEGKAGFRPVTWAARRGLRSTRPLSRRLSAGTYRLCVTAWDRAGNRSQSCARYRVR